MKDNSSPDLLSQLKVQLIGSKMRDQYIPLINSLNTQECIKMIEDALKQKVMKSNLRTIWRGEAEPGESSTNLSLEQQIKLEIDLLSLSKLSLADLRLKLVEETESSLFQNAFIMDWIEKG